MIYLLFQMQRVCRYASGPVKNYGSTSNYSPSYQTTRQNTNGYRFGRWTEIRDVYHEEVEKALQGKQSAAEALRKTEHRGNALLRAFERTAN